MEKVVITFGTFDVFHVGHLRLLERARKLGGRLVVGVSTDELNYKKKGRKPVYSQLERIEIISALKCVDTCFYEESLELKSDYIKNFDASILIMGNDWCGEFDHYSDLCDVIYLERTPSISTSEIIEKIKV